MRPALQAAGHPGCQQGEGLFVKPSSQKEIDFYQKLLESNSELLSVTPEFMGTLVTTDSSSPAPQPAGNGQGQPLIVLKDETAGFTSPNIADIKLGFRLWDDSAAPDKQDRLDRVSATTTSGSLGFRIAGMNVMQPNGERKCFDKQFGRQATAENVHEYLAHLFPLLHNEYVQAVHEAIGR